jgi:hypothetical protein
LAGSSLSSSNCGTTPHPARYAHCSRERTLTVIRLIGARAERRQQSVADKLLDPATWVKRCLPIWPNRVASPLQGPWRVA